jgi:hypothetical protein
MPDSPDLRASDEQRDRTAQEIREHFAAGRLTDDELNQRVQAVYDARTEQDLKRLLADLPKLPATPAQQKAELVARRRHLQRRMIQEAGGGAALFLLCTVIWLTSGASGQFWPIWVALVAVIPLVRNGWRLYGPAPDFDRVERELESGRARNERRKEIRGRAQDRAHDRAARHSRRDGGPPGQR